MLEVEPELGIILSKVLSALLEGLTLLDPVLWLVIAVILTVVALAAAFVPARRAAEIDPLTALRS